MTITSQRVNTLCGIKIIRLPSIILYVIDTHLYCYCDTADIRNNNTFITYKFIYILTIFYVDCT